MHHVIFVERFPYAGTEPRYAIGGMQTTWRHNEPVGGFDLGPHRTGYTFDELRERLTTEPYGLSEEDTNNLLGAAVSE